jgi:glycosyl transferase family 1
MLDSGAESFRCLILSDGLAIASEAQFEPLQRYATLLQDRLGVVFRFMRLAEGMRLERSIVSQFHILGLKFSFQARDPSQIVARFREQLSGTNTKLVYFDGDDDVCVQWPAVLRLVDLYVKKGVFADTENYLRPFVGKSNLTDYVSKEYGTSFEKMDIPKSGVLESADLTKLHLGWSTALDDRHVDLFNEVKLSLSSRKDVDILCRASVPQDWSFPLRNAVVSKLEPMCADYRVIMSLPTTRVPRRQYYDELLRSRVCVSPFGYGEVCGRDIEAITCGCLLIKPNMSHIRSHPDVFVPGETYVPVRWDYADLAEKCAYYLDREAERVRIASNVYQVLANYYRDNSFVATFRSVLERLGLTRVQRSAPRAI